MDQARGAAGELPEQLRLGTSRSARIVYVSLGFVFLGVGLLGYLVPGLPGTVNLLIALYFFSRSSERMYRWMLTNRWFGSALLDYQLGLGIPRRIKVAAVASITVAVTASAGFVVDKWWLRAGIVLLGAYGVWFVLTRPTREIEEARRASHEGGPI